jgi:plastocyanin domain-containing protein
MFRQCMLIPLLLLSAGFVSATAQTKHSRTIQSQIIRVDVTDSGYRPDSLHLRRGILTKLIFTRKTESACGRVLVIPRYGVHRELPFNRPVTITLRPRETGSFNFTCGMDMFRGEVIVN